jgi:hypothetical protein
MDRPSKPTCDATCNASSRIDTLVAAPLLTAPE